ncbi:hypothetical protein BJY01DRAFT_44964 [Aspergillus pseudoustus]|uniref:Uncharacterized protein n=1 Tax=Aspergillus pseudoustus TaxID=1810923 RepID=A0ABR4JBN2_9EURO
MLVPLFLPLLLLPSRILASSVPFEPTPLECDTDPEWLQPIAINLGLDSITAAYAYSHTNVSVLAQIFLYDRSVNLTGYKQTIQHLRQQHVKDYKKALRTSSPSRFKHVVAPVVPVVRDTIELAALFWEILLFRLGASTEWWTYPFWVSACVARYEYKQVSRFIEFAAQKVSGTEPQIELELDYIQDGFTQALKLIKERAYNNTGTSIFSAMILYPDFFNTAIQRRADDAAHYAGIQTLGLGPMTKRQVFERYAPTLLFNKTEPVGWENQPSLILLEQGASHFDLLTSGRHCMMAHPLEEMACRRLLVLLWARFSKRNADVLAEVTETGSWDTLGQKVMVARESMKAHRERECEVSEGFEECGGAELIEEWPLDLDDWWSSEERRRPVSLLWEDVEAVDEEYVDRMAECLDQAQLCLQGATRSPDPASSKTADGVAIMSTYCDGALLARAAKRSMGDHVHVFGSSAPWQDMTYMAKLGARAAVQVRQEVSKSLEARCRQQAKYSYQDGQSDPMFGRDEL